MHYTRDALQSRVRSTRRPEALMPSLENAQPCPKQDDRCLLDRDSSPQVGVTLRRARKQRQLSLREVERRIGRSNAYLSQVERGLIKRPDPVVLLELAELYTLSFELLAEWAGWSGPEDRAAGDSTRSDSTTALIRMVLELDDAQRGEALSFMENLLRECRT